MDPENKVSRIFDYTSEVNQAHRKEKETSELYRRIRPSKLANHNVLTN